MLAASDAVKEAAEIMEVAQRKARSRAHAGEVEAPCMGRALELPDETLAGAGGALAVARAWAAELAEFAADGGNGAGRGGAATRSADGITETQAGPEMARVSRSAGRSRGRGQAPTLMRSDVAARWR